MRFFLYVLTALALGTGFALFLADDPGYVQVVFRGWSLESTLGAVVLGIVALFVLVFGLVWLLKLFNPLKLLSPGTWKHLFSRKDPVIASNQGLELLLLGRWQEAYRLLVEQAERVDNPAFNYLAAALAAHERGDELGRNFCLDRAEKRTTGDNYGIRSLKALLETRTAGPEQGLVMLLALNRLVPESPFVLRQIKDCYIVLRDWNNLAGLLPALEKLSVVREPELHQLKSQIALYQLQHAGAESLEALQMVWQDLTKPMKQEEALITTYIGKLMHYGQETEACNLISKQLKNTWSDSLVAMLGYVNSTTPQHLLLLLEENLKDRPNNPVLLLTLGRVCLRNHLWGKAKEYFEQSLRMSKSGVMTAEISGELGRLLEHLGEIQASLGCYQRAMQLMEHKLPDLPMPVLR